MNPSASPSDICILIERIVSIIGDLRSGLLALAGIEFKDHAEGHRIKLAGRVFEPRLKFLLAVVVGLAVLLGDDKEVHAVVEHVDKAARLVLSAELDLLVAVNHARNVAAFEGDFELSQKLRAAVEELVFRYGVAVFVILLQRSFVGGYGDSVGQTLQPISEARTIVGEVLDGYAVT